MVIYTTPTSLSLSNGNYSFVFYANDTLGNLNYTQINFVINVTSSQDILGGGGGILVEICVIQKVDSVLNEWKSFKINLLDVDYYITRWKNYESC